MPRPRRGAIPPTRLADARRVRDHYRAALKGKGEAHLTVHKGTFAVKVTLWDGVDIGEPLPRSREGVSLHVTRGPRLCPTKSTS